MKAGNILYPNVTSLPGQSGIGQSERVPSKKDGVQGEFDRVFEQTLTSSDLSQVKPALKFSGHAMQRLQERKIALDSATMAKLNDAIDKAESKGVEDTLVLTQDAALIVNVNNRTVITAMDRNSLVGNVFTNIDGAVIV
jgi:flagellar operon protein